MQLYLNQQGSLSVPRQLYWFRHRYVFSLKICQKILRSREALHNRYQLNLKKGGFFKTTRTYLCASCSLPASSWWMRSAKFGSSPHQKSQSSRRPCRWLRRHTLSTSAFRQRLKLHRMGSSSVTGNSIGAEVGPCHTNLFHLIPVRSAWHTGEEQGGKRSLSVHSCCFKSHSAPSRKNAGHSLKSINGAFWSRPPSYQASTTVWLKSQMTRERGQFRGGLEKNKKTNVFFSTGNRITTTSSPQIEAN